MQCEDPLQKLITLHERRIDKYTQADINIEINPNFSVEEVTDKVASEILGFIENNPPRWKQWMKEKERLAPKSAMSRSSKLTAEFDEDLLNGVALPKSTDELNEGNA